MLYLGIWDLSNAIFLEGQKNNLRDKIALFIIRTSFVDAYAKFKIGAIFTVPEGKIIKKSIRSFQPRIEIEHRCNQASLSILDLMVYINLF
jgi:hypothetical protein